MMDKEPLSIMCVIKILASINYVGSGCDEVAIYLCSAYVQYNIFTTILVLSSRLLPALTSK